MKEEILNMYLLLRFGMIIKKKKMRVRTKINTAVLRCGVLLLSKYTKCYTNFNTLLDWRSLELFDVGFNYFWQMLEVEMIYIRKDIFNWIEIRTKETFIFVFFDTYFIYTCSISNSFFSSVLFFLIFKEFNVTRLIFFT